MEVLNNIENWLKKEYPHILLNAFASAEETQKRSLNCEGITGSIRLLLSPTTEAELQAIISYCRQNQVNYSIISTGQNWGYGSSRSINDYDIVISLQKIDKILSFDVELGIVELNPGVTIQKLYDYLSSKELDWMVPTTGAGPNGSILANALEKGFGLNPIADHFSAIISMRVLLPSGEIYESRLAETGAHKSDHVNRWKVGPYLEGLFAQSSLGIVLSAKIALARKPKEVSTLVVKADKRNLNTLVDAIQELRQYFPNDIGAVNIMNANRVETTASNQNLKKSWLHKKLEKLLNLNFADYNCIIPIYSYHASHKLVVKEMKKTIKREGLKVDLLTEAKISLLRKICGNIKTTITNLIYSRLGDMLEFTKLMKGIPTYFTLSVAYSKSYNQNKTNNPAQDKVGLLWFAPILSLKPEEIQEMIDICTPILESHNQEAALTFTNLDHRLVEATIPLYFNQNSEQCEENRDLAMKCWQALYDACLAAGYSPYRFSVKHMDLIKLKNPAAKKIYDAIKNAIDPDNLCLKGRYE